MSQAVSSASAIPPTDLQSEIITDGESGTRFLEQRDGLQFSKYSLKTLSWPFRLDIPYEFQCWVLTAVTLGCCLLCCLPCICGTFRNKVAKKFTVWVYTRLHTFFTLIFYVNLTIICVTVCILPDWTLNEYFVTLLDFVTWFLTHSVKFLTSLTILLALFVFIKFKERIAIAMGIEHVVFFRLGKWNLFHSARMRPIELIVWKLETLASGPKLKANDVFVEVHIGQNEPCRSRVHNNAGSDCVMKESFQMNIDENDPTETMTLLVKDQSMVTNHTLGKLTMKTSEVLRIESQTGQRTGEDFTYSPGAFVQLQLQPQGKVWLRVSGIEEERAPLMGGFSGIC